MLQSLFESGITVQIAGELRVVLSRKGHTTAFISRSSELARSYRRPIVDIYEARAEAQQLQSLLVS
jgi:hypothetical protein